MGRRCTAVPLWRRAAGLAVVAMGSMSGSWASEPQRAVRFEAERVVAFADVHGAYLELTQLLRSVGLVDEQLAWQGGTTHLVSLGDLLDRGPDSRGVMDLLRRLQQEAELAGGRVHVLLGNHELMNLTGDLRYVSARDLASFAEVSEGPVNGQAPGSDPSEARVAAFAPEGVYGNWLMSQPVAVVINDTAFVHGGLSPLVARGSPELINSRFSAALAELLTLRTELIAGGLLQRDEEVTDAAARLEAHMSGEATAPSGKSLPPSARRFVELAADPLFGADGPLWYRGTAWCHPIIEQPVLEEALAAWEVARVVAGHTTTSDHRVHARLAGHALLADTGMLASHYHGRPSALILEPGRPAQVVYADGPAVPEPLDVDDGSLLYPVPEAALMTALETGPLLPAPDAADAGNGSTPLRLDLRGQAVDVAFTPASKRRVRAELAAWRLDGLLGLDIVAPVAARRLNGKSGFVRAVWPNAVTESERLAAGMAVTNPCAVGSSYDLLYAFDALIGNVGRSADNLLYDRRTWRLASTDHGRSFGRSRRLPAYLEGSPHRLPSLLADRLRSLDAAVLGEHLGDLLSDAEIAAIGRRRDLLLETWALGY